jgi:hypothetical protein
MASSPGLQISPFIAPLPRSSRLGATGPGSEGGIAGVVGRF